MVMLVITVMTWQFIDMFHWLRSSSKPSPRVDDLCAERGMFFPPLRFQFSRVFKEQCVLVSFSGQMSKYPVIPSFTFTSDGMKECVLIRTSRSKTENQDVEPTGIYNCWLHCLHSNRSSLSY